MKTKFESDDDLSLGVILNVPVYVLAAEKRTNITRKFI